MNRLIIACGLGLILFVGTQPGSEKAPRTVSVEVTQEVETPEEIIACETKLGQGEDGTAKP